MASSSVPRIKRDGQNAQKIVIGYQPAPGLGWLSVKNFLLSMLTLGIYRFWAKTNVRRHIWSCVHINGEPLEYTGTGTELFMGFILATVIIFIPLLVLALLIQFIAGELAAAVFQLVVVFLLTTLIGMAKYRALRYRLSRTIWRGIRGTMTGSPFSYSMLYFGALLLSSLTLGWSNPAMSVRLQQRITREASFGRTAFSFGGPASPLYRTFAFCWIATLAGLAVLGVAIIGDISNGNDSLLRSIANHAMNNPDDPRAAFVLLAVIYGSIAVAVLTYSVIWTFYTAAKLRLFASYTGFDQARFSLEATAFSLFRLWFGNLLIMLLSFGIAAPFASQRMVRYFCDRLKVSGTVDFAAIQQSPAPLDGHGEGLLDAFDLDSI